MRTLYRKYKIYGLRKFVQYACIELYHRLWLHIVKKSFSQKGEDLLIDKLLQHKGKGFYIDIGAYDPHRFSNTKRFYLKGWRGINIEPNLISYRKFLKNRPEDINLNIGIASEAGKMIFHEVFPETLSTFSLNELKEYENQGYRVIGMKEISVRKLSDVLEEYCANRSIDFMTIDTEGYDLDVLKSNDWSRFRPRVVCVETAQITRAISKKKASINEFLTKNGYKQYLDNGLNTIFVA